MAGYESSRATNYLKTQVETASPEMLVLMLYDGALKFIRRSRLGFEDMDFEQINNSLIRAQAILSELMTSLDMEKGGEVAKNLLSLYIFINQNLSKANIDKDASHLDICDELISGLRSAWDEMMKKPGVQKEEKINKPMPGINIAV